MTQGGGVMTGQRLGDYELRQLLGVGGMAEVYRGYDVVLQREVAVKVLAGSLASDRDFVERFRAEARRVAALNHPNVVPVYAAGEERGSLYLVMPILSDSLRDLLSRERRLPIAEAVLLAAQVASGLDAAHAIGIVHRDVKPENILVDADGMALLTDFGIAREMTPRSSGSAATLSATGLPVGTPEYMAPEQLRGEPLDARTDVYALAMVTYELLTGVLPFAGETPYDIAVKVITAPLPPPSVHNPMIPPALDRAVLRALARVPADRFPSAADFATALRGAASGRAAVGSALLAPALWYRLSGASRAAASVVRRVRDRIPQPRLVVAGALAAFVLATTVGGVLLARGHTAPRSSVAVRPTATATATATATLVPPTATPTIEPTSPAPRTPLMGIPSIFTLIPSAQDPEICTATQVVSNTTQQTVGWSWQGPAASGFQFKVNNGKTVSWPADKLPGIAPGGADTIVAITTCRQMLPNIVTVIDTQGTTYTFILSVSPAATPTPTTTG